MRKRRKVKVERIVGYGSLALLSVITLGLLFPIVGIGANAEELTASLTTQTSAYLYSTIALSTSDNIAVDIVPKAGGRVEVGTADVFVSTNNTTGYSISLSAVNPSNRLEQVDQTLSFENDSSKGYSISPLSTRTTYANYLDSPANINTWGYALTSGEADGSTEYEGLTSASNTIKTVRSTASNDSYKLNVAVAADTSLPAGSYRNGLIVTAVANPITLRGFNSIYYMQQMTPEICNEIVIPEGELAVTGELVDKRDNTIYQVAKLLDGNCWMTQNLALDLSTEVALTPEDSDVSKDWVPKTSTETRTPTSVDGANDRVRSWNLGKIVLNNPTEANRCADILGDNLTVCEWLTDVSNGYIADADLSKYSPTSSTYVDEFGNRYYNPHYLLGNYYQYGAATAGTGIGLTGTGATDAEGNGLTHAPSSICPKGWQLPKAGKDIDTSSVNYGQAFNINGSFYGLLSHYGYTADKWITNLNSENQNNGNSYFALSAGSVNPTYAPIYFVRGGNVSPVYGSLLSAGSGAMYYSSTARHGNDTMAYQLSISSIIFPSGDTYRGGGDSIRCLAR